MWWTTISDAKSFAAPLHQQCSNVLCSHNWPTMREQTFFSGSRGATVAKTNGKLRAKQLEDIKAQSRQHSLLGHIPATASLSSLVPTGVAASLYREYTEEWSGRYCLVLHGTNSTGKTCAGMMLAKGRSPYAPSKSLYFGVKHPTCPNKWYQGIYQAVMGRSSKQQEEHAIMDDYQLARLLGEALKLEKKEQQEEIVASSLDEICRPSTPPEADEDDTLITCHDLENKAQGPQRDADDVNGVLILDDMNFALKTGQNEESFSLQMGVAFTFARSLVEIASMNKFLVVFITNQRPVAKALLSIRGNVLAAASHFTWTPKRRMRILAKRFSSLLEHEMLREYAEKEDMDMKEICCVLDKMYYRSKLPALACTSTTSNT